MKKQNNSESEVFYKIISFVFVQEIIGMIHLTRKAQSPMSAPTGKWRKARRQLLSHHSFYPIDPEGQGDEARHQEKHNRLSLPRQANGEKRGGSSSATGAFTHLTPRGKAEQLDIKKSTIACLCPDRQMEKSTEKLSFVKVIG